MRLLTGGFRQEPDGRARSKTSRAHRKGRRCSDTTTGNGRPHSDAPLCLHSCFIYKEDLHQKLCFSDLARAIWRLFNAGRILSGTKFDILNYEEIKMKKKILLTVSAVLALGIGVAAFAYSNTTAAASTAMSCCPKGADSCPMKMKDDAQSSTSHDSCPMKTKDSSGKETASCCDNCDCCKGDSCPMKHKADALQTQIVDVADKQPASTASSCDCPCCGGRDAKKDG